MFAQVITVVLCFSFSASIMWSARLLLEDWLGQ